MIFPSVPRGASMPVLAAALLTLALNVGTLRADAEGMIVSIPTAITTESTNRLRGVILGPLKRFESGASKQGGKFVIICEFNPDGKRAACDDFGASYTLAQYLRSLPADIKGVSTVAYVSGEVTRHSVLPVLACTEIVFSPEGKLGQVTTERPASKVEQAAYEEIARNRFPAVLVRKMYDGSAEVLKSGDQYVDGSQKPRPPGEQVPELAGNETALYSFELARKVGLCQQLASNRLDDVRVAYGVPRGGVQRAIDRSAVWRIPVEGELDGETVEQVQRRIRRALAAGANLLILDLRCAGGQLDQAYDLGLYLAKLNDNRPERPVETIAYVTNQARNLALFPAMGCSRIVMQKEDSDEKDAQDLSSGEARLGGFGHYLDRHPDLEAIRRKKDRLRGDKRIPLDVRLPQRRTELQEELLQKLKDLASRQNFPEAIIEGMCSREMQVVAVERATGASGRLFLTGDQFRADQQGPKLYKQSMKVKPWMDQARYDHEFLTLSADQARQLGLIHSVVKDYNDLCAVEGVVPEQVRSPDADWLDGLADFLRNPWTSVILVMVGITCLMLEFKTPGVGLPGVLAAICFVLFFWAHSQLHGQITWLAVLLFVLGLALIALEIFVLPGFGICGISGVILVLASLGLVAYGHWPRSGDDWLGFGQQLAPFGISMLGSLALLALILKYLPHIPILNRLISKSPQENEDGPAEPELPMVAEYRALLGAIGVAATPLRPAGKSQFGDAFVDVVADGGYIMPGTRVQVIEVEGNRVVVKEV
jgi:membrane-bound serine protease (ClpP class)